MGTEAGQAVGAWRVVSNLEFLVRQRVLEPVHQLPCHVFGHVARVAPEARLHSLGRAFLVLCERVVHFVHDCSDGFVPRDLVGFRDLSCFLIFAKPKSSQMLLDGSLSARCRTLMTWLRLLSLRPSITLLRCLLPLPSFGRAASSGCAALFADGFMLRLTSIQVRKGSSRFGGRSAACACALLGPETIASPRLEGSSAGNSSHPYIAIGDDFWPFRGAETDNVFIMFYYVLYHLVIRRIFCESLCVFEITVLKLYN